MCTTAGRRKPSLFVSALVLAALGLPSSLFAQSTRVLTVDDLFAIQRVGNPQISPDGKWVAFTVSQISLEDEKSETRLWMIPATGGDRRGRRTAMRGAVALT